ncbi:hypothetical protein Q8F55_007581 [Vanrija albida]|uniref:Uncharacterized protein n=1 Tax=Vanrija albida TaxID=181172 RepID=A0ABR3PU81_9TREE
MSDNGSSSKPPRKSGQPPKSKPLPPRPAHLPPKPAPAAARPASPFVVIAERMAVARTDSVSFVETFSDEEALINDARAALAGSREHRKRHGLGLDPRAPRRRARMADQEIEERTGSISPPTNKGRELRRAAILADRGMNLESAIAVVDDEGATAATDAAPEEDSDDDADAIVAIATPTKYKKKPIPVVDISESDSECDAETESDTDSNIGKKVARKRQRVD